MSCPSSARIAAASSGQDRVAAEHAAGCVTCAAALARDRETQALLAEAPEVRLSDSDRAALRAELLAASDMMSIRPRRRGYRVVVIGAAMAAVAAAAFLVAPIRLRPGPPDEPSPRVVGVPAAQVVASGASPVIAAGSAAEADPGALVGVEPAPAPAPIAEIVSRGARFERAGDLVRVADGAVTLDARGRRAAQVVVRGAQVRIDNAKVRVTVRTGRLVQVQVFAGAAEINVAGRAQVIEAGEVWEPAPPRSPPAPAPAPPVSAAPPAKPAPVGSSPALAAFRAGWQALRAGRNAEAIAAFDRATDPAVAEDASYWAAIAAARAGDRDGAKRRLRAFVVAFPASPHADEARAALRP